MTRLILIVGMLVTGIAGCANSEKSSKNNKMDSNQLINDTAVNATDTALFGAGCFWCVEAIFQRLKGVATVESGYSGGTVNNPSYRDVCTGTTGHAEVARITFDSKIISYKELLAVLFTTHDPTSMNRQGADEGTQYRSAIFYYNDEQKDTALQFIKETDAQGIFSSKIVTEVTPVSVFYKAEADHQNFYNQNTEYGYCRAVINPKLEKLRKIFKDKLKEGQ